MSKDQWTSFKGYERSKKPVLPGVWRLRQGGYLIRGRVTSLKTGRMVEVCHAVDGNDPALAYQELQRELQQVRTGDERTTSSRMRFATFAAQVFEERVMSGEVRSASTRRNWRHILEEHLLRPYPDGFGDMFLDAITVQDVFAWRQRLAQLLTEGATCHNCGGQGVVYRGEQKRRCASCKGSGTKQYNPRSLNNLLYKLQVITKAARVRKLIAEDPAVDVKPLPTDLVVTYTEEEPNSLTEEEAVSFLEGVWQRYPRWYAMVVLGMVTGWRPSQLRPLRRQGSTPDLNILPDGTAWLYSRRSHSEGKEIMEKTKTGKRIRVRLPIWVVSVLSWHMERLGDGPEQVSELLFPGRDGGLLDECCLYHPFKLVARAAGFKKKITPRALRRTYQDLQRAVSTPDVITRSISGHVTEEMQHHYSTIHDEEQVASLEKLGKLLRFHGGGMKSGMKQTEPGSEGSEQTDQVLGTTKDLVHHHGG